jgi:hypothetical protein
VTGYLRYHPVIGDADREVEVARPARLLVVGTHVPDSVTAAEAARQQESAEAQLPIGVYIFDDGAQVEVMVVSTGASPAAPEQIDWTIDQHRLVSAYDWMGAWWEDAAAESKPMFDVKSSAITRGGGQEAVVRSRDFDRGQWWYRVRVDGRTINVPERDLLAPDVDDDPYEWIARDPAAVTGSPRLSRGRSSGSG